MKFTKKIHAYMLLMTRLHTASVQVNRHEGLCNLPSRKLRKEGST